MAVKRFTLGFICLLLLAGMLQLSGCSIVNSYLQYYLGPEIEYEVVFVNLSDESVVSVWLEGQSGGGYSQRADTLPLEREETLGFEGGMGYPIAVTVFDGPDGQGEALGELTLSQPPEEGERWYVTARSGADGLTMEVSTSLPEE